MAFKEYENIDELKKVQDLSLGILAEFDRVCRKLGINYAVYGGTAIGTVRHGGFIPWDDDVDVCLERSEYERFLAEAPSELDPKFDIVNARLAQNFPCTYSFMTLKDTVLVPEFYQACEYEKPFSIDVFPLDYAASSPLGFKLQSFRTWVWGRMMFLRATPCPYLPFDGIKRNAVHLACGMAHRLLKLFHVSSEQIQSKWERASRMFESHPTGQLADFSDRSPLKWGIRKDELEDTIDMPFESILVRIPRSYDEVLTRGYGDYMSLPPVEQRKNHYPSRLDFGPYSNVECQSLISRNRGA